MGNWQARALNAEKRLGESNLDIQQKIEELKKLQNLLDDAIVKQEEAIEMQENAELNRQQIEKRIIMQEESNEQQLAEAERLKKEAIERVNKYIEENETKKQQAAEEEEKAKDLIEKKKNELKILRSSNACNQENIDIIQAKIKKAEKIKREAEKKQRDAEKKQEEAEKQRQNEEKRTERIKELQKFELKVNFIQRPENLTIRSTEIGDNSPPSTSPIQIECFTNPEKLIDSADQVINNIYTNHHEHNLKTYVQNKIVIDEMTDKINNINSRLQYKMNKNINYGPDGQLNFY